MKPNLVIKIVLLALLLCGVSIVGCSTITVDPGHEGVVILWGEVQETLESGTHFRNPMVDVQEFDIRWKLLDEREIEMQSSDDQLTTLMDVSVQWRIISGQADKILADTGTAEALIHVHLNPRLRSVLREQGKSVQKAEQFFKEEIQAKLQVNVKASLQEAWIKVGVEVGDVMIRNLKLPATLIAAIEQKKEREQAGERQKAELERYKTEMEQQVATAEAQRRAAEEQARQIKALADANAYEIATRGKAIRENPEILRLRWIEKWTGDVPSTIAGQDASFLLNPGK